MSREMSMWPDDMVVGLKEEVEILYALKDAAYRVADEVAENGEAPTEGIALLCAEVDRLRSHEADSEKMAELGLPCVGHNFCGEDCDLLKWERGRADRLTEVLYREKRGMDR